MQRPTGRRSAAGGDDPRDREIERLRTLVAELTRRNEVLEEALRRLQGLGSGGPPG